MDTLNQEQMQFLHERVFLYNWWQTADEALEMPDLIVAKMMNTGQLVDIKRLLNLFHRNYLINLLKTARIGQFSPQSWQFWHCYLLKLKHNEIPNLPTRFQR